MDHPSSVQLVMFLELGAPVSAKETGSNVFEEAIFSAFGNDRFWHIADKPTAPAFVGYWTNNGQRSARGLNGSVANDPGCVKTPEA